MSTLTITRIDQARLLADPLKLSIIQELGITPHTTKQVAGLLKEKPTKLYRHVEALREAGLVELVEERPKRGTIEKYYLAAARRFEIHPDLFAPANEEGAALVDEMLGSTYAEMRRALYEMQTNPHDDENLKPCFMKFSVRASENDIKELRMKMLGWLEDCQDRNKGQTRKDDLQWSGLIAFYPDPTD